MNREQLTKLYELTDEVKNQKEVASELLRTAKDRFGHVKQKLERDGKEIEVTEKVLWDEVYYLGFQCQAGKILDKLHPEVLEAYRKQDVMADELKKFTIIEFGIDFTQLTISDYLKMTEGLFNIMLEEKGLINK